MRKQANAATLSIVRAKLNALPPASLESLERLAELTLVDNCVALEQFMDGLRLLCSGEPATSFLMGILVAYDASGIEELISICGPLTHEAFIRRFVAKYGLTIERHLRSDVLVHGDVTTRICGARVDYEVSITTLNGAALSFFVDRPRAWYLVAALLTALKQAKQLPPGGVELLEMFSVDDQE